MILLEYIIQSDSKVCFLYIQPSVKTYFITYRPNHKIRVLRKLPDKSLIISPKRSIYPTYLSL